jgi:hypothetical protein
MIPTTKIIKLSLINVCQSISAIYIK